MRKQAEVTWVIKKRLGFLEKIWTNNFSLSDAEVNNGTLLTSGGIADLLLLKILFVIH